MKKLFLLPLAAAIASCSFLADTVHGTNRDLTFKTRDDVVRFFEEKNNISPDDLYFFNTKNDFAEFYTDKRLFERAYYGIMLNDSVMIDDRQDLSKYCVGYNAKQLTAYNPEAPKIQNPLYKRNLTNIKGDTLSFNRANPTIVIVAHSNLGNTIKKNIEDYKKETADTGKEFNYIFVTLDLPESDYGMPKENKADKAAGK